MPFTCIHWNSVIIVHLQDHAAIWSSLGWYICVSSRLSDQEVSCQTSLGLFCFHCSLCIAKNNTCKNVAVNLNIFVCFLVRSPPSGSHVFSTEEESKQTSPWKRLIPSMAAHCDKLAILNRASCQRHYRELGRPSDTHMATGTITNKWRKLSHIWLCSMCSKNIARFHEQTGTFGRTTTNYSVKSTPLSLDSLISPIPLLHRMPLSHPLETQPEIFPYCMFY